MPVISFGLKGKFFSYCRKYRVPDSKVKKGFSLSCSASGALSRGARVTSPGFLALFLNKCFLKGYAWRLKHRRVSLGGIGFQKGSGFDDGMSFIRVYEKGGQPKRPAIKRQKKGVAPIGAGEGEPKPCPLPEPERDTLKTEKPIGYPKR